MDPAPMALAHPDAAAAGRLRWRCRRGLLENDLVLQRFLAGPAAGLDLDGLRAFEALLEFDDNTLWDLISARADCRDPALDAVVRLLRRC